MRLAKIFLKTFHATLLDAECWIVDIGCLQLIDCRPFLILNVRIYVCNVSVTFGKVQSPYRLVVCNNLCVPLCKIFLVASFNGWTRAGPQKRYRTSSPCNASVCPVKPARAIYRGNNCSILWASMMFPLALSFPVIKACIPLVCLLTIPSQVSPDMVSVTEGDE